MASFKSLVLRLEFAECLRHRPRRVETGNLVMAVDRKHETRDVGPGLNLQFHVRVAVIAQPQCVDRGRPAGSLARPLERRRAQELIGRAPSRQTSRRCDDAREPTPDGYASPR